MKKLLISSILGLVMSQSAFAALDNKAMLEKIQKEYPNLNVSAVTYLPEVKLYEIKTQNNSPLSFTNENIDYFILNGQIIDPKNKVNVSTERDMEQLKELFNSLPFDKSIPVKFGTGARKIAIFTDPDCPYCKATDQAIYNQMTKDNLSISYFMNPLNIVGHEQAPLKAKKIWCSPNKSAAWENWMLNGILPDNPGTCANPVDETKEMSTQLGFNSTPTIMFDNGFIWRGQISPEQIREILNKKAP